MSDEENVATAPSTESATEDKPTIKAKDVMGQTFDVVGARDTTGKYGPQVLLQVKGGHVIYLSEKSSIAKGLKSGNLKVPFKVLSTQGYGAKGPYAMFTLAPRA